MKYKYCGIYREEKEVEEEGEELYLRLIHQDSLDTLCAVRKDGSVGSYLVEFSKNGPPHRTSFVSFDVAKALGVELDNSGRIILP